MEPSTSSDYMDIESIPIVIEELDSYNLGEDELSEFVLAETIPSVEGITNISNQTIIELTEQEEILIKQLIDGQLTYTEYNAKMGRNDEDIDQEDYEEYPPQLIVPPKKDAPLVKTETRHRRKKSILPVALQGLMGEANLCYARGDIQLAEKVCLEIIRQVPLAPEPFLTLAQIYETSDPEKFMQFTLIAAHLNPTNVDQWIRLADLSLEQGNVKQAITSYTRAIKINNKDIDLRMRRIELLESIGEDKLAFRCYFGMLPYIGKERGAFLLSTAKMVAEKFHKENNLSKALDAMNHAYDKIPEMFETEDINILLELLIATGSYKNVLDVLSIHSGLQYQHEEIICDGETKTKILSCFIPEFMILDFRTKVSVSLIHLKTNHLIDFLIDNALTCIDVEEAGDCYLDIAEALMKEKLYKKALTLLIPLVNSKNFSLAAVWLRHADCHRAIEDFDAAIESYRTVVNLAPQHLDARLTLSALLKRKGRDQEALEALEQDLESDLLDASLLYERCFILKETKNWDQFYDVGFLLISRHCIKIRSRDEMESIVQNTKVSARLGAIRDLRKTRCENVDDVDVPEFSPSPNDPSPEIEFELFRDIMKVACMQKKFSMAVKLSFYAMTSKRFQPFMKEVEFMAMLACIYNKESYFSYNLVKEYISKNIKNPCIWNLLAIVIQFSDDIRYSRFLMRIFHKRDTDPIVHIMQANYCLVSGTYKYALNDYMSINKKTKEPMLSLLIGITLCQMASQKFSAKKHSLITQSIGFMEKYRETREKEAVHEIHYNYGRIYQQFGMTSLAIYHYKEVLAFNSDFIDENSAYLNLKMEAAFNLHLIYKLSGNFELATKYLYDFIIV